MTLLFYIKENKRILSFFLLVMLIINFILLVSVDLSISLNDILYLNFLVAVVSIIYGSFGYMKWIKSYKHLRQALDDNEKINGMMLGDKGFYTILIKDVIKNKELEASLQKQELKKSMDELNDYITNEPTGALDSKSATELLNCLTEMNEKFNTTIIMVTHDAFAASFCKRVLFLADGQLHAKLNLNTSRKELYQRILTMMASLGGGEHNGLF